jgi:outer membrane murein-binding lipoprotein Lpp
VDTLNLVLTAGTLSRASLDRVVSAISALPADIGTNTANDLERVRSAIYLVLTSPSGVIQK